MGLFDFLKANKSKTETIVATPPKAGGVYNRRVKVQSVCESNSDGTSRQKILSEIYHKKGPFVKNIEIEIQGSAAKKENCLEVLVNGFCVGEVEDGMSAFISARKEDIVSIHSFKVDWTSPLDKDIEDSFYSLENCENMDFYKYRERKIQEKDREYFAKMKIAVRSKT